MAEKLTTESARALNAKLKEAHSSGRTQPADWRVSQLEAIEQMLHDCEPEFTEALNQDLGKPATEAWLTEISFAAAHQLKVMRKNRSVLTD